MCDFHDKIHSNRYRRDGALLEDNEILNLFLAREEQVIAELHEKHGRICGRIARNILRDDLDAEE